MSGEARGWLDKSAKAIRSAEIVLNSGVPDFAVGRAYYAMFYAAKAVLAGKGLNSNKHSGVHALFGLHFAKPGLLDRKYHDWMLRAFQMRLQEDYGFDVEISPADARETIARAREFLAAAEAWLAADAK